MKKVFAVNLPGREQAVVFDIPDSAKRVGLMFSGGVDSTLVLSVLAQIQREAEFDLTAFTVENKNDSESYARSILQLPEFKNVRHVANVPNDADFTGVIDRGIYNVLIRDDVDVLFTGVTSNPPHLMEQGPFRRGQEILDKYSKLRCPFMFLTKDIVLRMYMQHCHIDWRELYKKTHSCTQLPVGECGACFQCVEKKWAEAESGFNIKFFS